jgi:hypothetical protein
MLMPVIAVCLATQTLIRLACGMVIDGARRAAASSCWATRGGSTPLVPACTAVPVAASTESCFKAKPCHGHCFPNLLSGDSSSHPTPGAQAVSLLLNRNIIGVQVLGGAAFLEKYPPWCLDPGCSRRACL